MRLGVCYYPEQWPRTRWPVDAAMMVETGLEVVRIGEFAWSVTEPERDRFAWEWLDEAISCLADAGLEVVLGTPTATPPVWLLRERPEVLSVGPDGRRRAYGSRRHTCPTSPAYREEARRITTALADRYGAHPAVTAWQLDNEPGNHDSTRCWCDACQDAFTRWLADRFAGDIDAMNEAWGTTFWSQTYRDLDDVRLPVPTMTGHNPALLLAHLRFASAQVVEGLREQRDIVTARAPNAAVLTNLYIGTLDVSGQAVGRLHGLGAMDSYPHGVRGPEEVAFLLDHTRGTALQPTEGCAARGGRGWVVEQQPGGINWTPTNPHVPPGQVRLWGWQAALHGIDTLLFFRWRAARAGQEQYHTGLLRHDGTPDQGLAEARRLAAELAAAPAELLHRPEARVALLHDDEDGWALGIDPHREGLTHRDLVLAAHVGARRLGLDVDVVPPDVDLAGYSLVLAPALHLATGARVAALLAAADAGAEVVVGVRSLVKDVEDAWVQEPAPAGLVARVGARVDTWGSTDVWPEGADDPLRVRFGDDEVAAGAWAETFVTVQDEPLGGDEEGNGGPPEVLARFVAGQRDGAPAAVRRDRVTLLGASSPEAWTSLLASLTGLTPSHPSVEAFVRGGAPVTIDHRTLEVRGVPDLGG